MAITLVVSAFFLVVVLTGVYLGITGQQEFSVETRPPESLTR